MRILVTGAAGFVARYLVPELASHGHDAFATDIAPKADGIGVPYVRCDLCDANETKTLVSRIRPDACIHLAGVTSIPEAAANPGRLYAINIGGTINVLEALSSLDSGASVLFVSTAQVYGCTPRPDPSPVDESAETFPASPYAISKVAGEAATRAYGRYRGLRAFVARPSNHTGPGQTARFVVPSLVGQAKAILRGERRAFAAGDTASGRDFSDVRDIVSAYRAILEHGDPGTTYNICAGTRMTIAKLIEAVKSAAGIDAPVETVAGLVRPTDFSRVLDTSRVRALGWSPTHSLADTLRDMMDE